MARERTIRADRISLYDLATYIIREIKATNNCADPTRFNLGDLTKHLKQAKSAEY